MANNISWNQSSSKGSDQAQQTVGQLLLNLVGAPVKSGLQAGDVYSKYAQGLAGGIGGVLSAPADLNKALAGGAQGFMQPFQQPKAIDPVEMQNAEILKDEAIKATREQAKVLFKRDPSAINRAMSEYYTQYDPTSLAVTQAMQNPQMGAPQGMSQQQIPGQNSQQAIPDQQAMSQQGQTAQPQSAGFQALQEIAGQQTTGPLAMLQDLIAKASGGLISTPTARNMFDERDFRRAAKEKMLDVYGEQAKAEMVPLSAKDRATLEKDVYTKNLERVDKFFEKLNEPLAGAKDLSLVESSITALDDLTNLLGVEMDQSGNAVLKNKDLLGSNNVFSTKRKELKRYRDAFINKALRRETGAVIGKEEEEQFRKTFGFEIGLKAFMQNPEIIAKSLIQQKQQFMRDRENLSPNSDARNYNQFLISKGLTTEQRKQALAKSGMLG